MATIDWHRLREAAHEATTRSYSPYSGTAVGAAGLLQDGTVLRAANVENASYVAGICAETALVGLLYASGAQGADLVAVAVSDATGADLAPCGRCRQLLYETGGPALVVNEVSMRTLLPDAFGPEDLAGR